MKKEEQKWLVLDLGDSWQAVLPDPDTQPHSKIVVTYPDGEKDATLADFDCPCKPQVNFKDRIIVHYSFLESPLP